jgi:glycosyltransferase involved in cell wall biosynthesis
MQAAVPLVSVIIPVYNGDRYIAQAVESVLNQTYHSYEVVVVDDGSTDDTQRILQGYGDRLHAIWQENQGVAIARNRGIQASQGELVAFLDADDFFLPDKLAGQVAVFAAQPSLGIVHSGWQRVNAQGECLTVVEPWEKVPHLNLEAWLRWKPVLPSAMMFRREWLERVGGFDPRFPPAEDTELVLRLAASGCQADWLRQVTVCYRQHDQSAMHQGLPQAQALAAAIDHFFTLPQLPETIRLIEPQVRYNTFVWIAWYLYHTRHASEMAVYLQRAWDYTPYAPVETIVNWADSFAAFAEAAGDKLDADALGRSAEWQQLMDWVVETRSLMS